MRCFSCGREDLSVVYFETLGHVVFAYCRHCEHRRWESAGNEVDVESILGAASEITPGRSRR